MPSSCSATSAACQATGCKGQVVITLATAVTLQVGCRAVDSAYPCTVCGRLHWSNGNLVFNRQHQAAFYDPQTGVQNRDMNADDKLAFIQGMIAGAKQRDDAVIAKDIARDLLATLGTHAGDCLVDQGRQCNCGVLEAADFARSLE